MDIMNFFDAGYEIVGSAPTYDDAYDIVDDFNRLGYRGWVITRYKRSVGYEDAYAVLYKEIV